MRKVDRTGQIVGKLKVVRQGPYHVQSNGRKRITWQCLCECGNTTFVEAGNLRPSHTTSCGCLVKEVCSKVGKTNLRHGRTKTREWLAWRGAKDRCYNPFAPQYVNYGARGIRMSEAWRDSFEKFFEDMGECPPNYSLDRIDVNRGYSAENCRWASDIEQMRNRRCTPRVMWNGRLTVLRELAEEYNMPYSVVKDRILRSFWPTKMALTKPVQKRRKTK